MKLRNSNLQLEGRKSGAERKQKKTKRPKKHELIAPQKDYSSLSTKSNPSGELTLNPPSMIFLPPPAAVYLPFLHPP
ncbi:hypothetical protein CEXT_133771 [Caerostris extrusa]|uniref:Uncharacterized protein n=1 Tax=Caerostris extrusa TaxID=172846 RepID=A0AAV4WKR7_CAEEX|nr:hypothetical protein CEXT_133771 [Caerostris extrusa]